METMKTWYGLKDAHEDFTIANDTDAALFFARHELSETHARGRLPLRQP